MDSGLRVVGFTFSNHCESTLNAEVSNAKLQTQRSLLSELLAIHAVGDISTHSDSQSNDSEDDREDDEDVGTEPAPIVQADTFGAQSDPIPIPCPDAGVFFRSLANQRAKDAYRRLILQRQFEQMYYKQKQQLKFQVQQRILIQQQRRLQDLRQQQNQPAATQHQSGQEHAVAVQTRGPNVTVPVY
ncbi:hypothetical protein Vretimale_9470 [Volvox reticuliferus]|uniref:Uncharacterized protein n=1 Tax=Volvox reticuliferus TaxID=1737510 RepID=A0A8J4LQ16_9CHLO|nr:hypothetical protein Vretifemale_18715 [Volvox reticuliferus]GIM04994.1 hypothetical protein Vretimale_9470 [Volvox reticuliferus]